MLRTKQKELLDYLFTKNTPVSALKLSKILQVSIRTIKNYVVEINGEHEQKIVISSRQGYFLSHNLLSRNIVKQLHSQKNSFPKTYQDRAHFIIKSILLFKRSSNIYDLSNDLCISDSTLKALIYKMNTSFQRFNVKFLCKNSHVEILGAEHDLRKLVSYSIFEQTNYRFIDLKVLEKTFESNQVKDVVEIIKSVFDRSELYLSDLSYINLVLHFLILIERLKKSRHLDNQILHIENSDLKLISDELCDKFQLCFGICFPENERRSCYLFLKTNTNFNRTDNEFIDLVGTELYQFTQQIAESVQEHYLINLNSDDFISLLALHLSGLQTRLKHNIYTRNPMLDIIKKECRIIFDVAIFISLQLNRFFSNKLNEDEISFIALHVGAEFERQKRNITKVGTVLLCPGYRGIENKIYHQLLRDFGDEINIIKVISQPSELEGIEFELLITTINFPLERCYETVYISPFHLRDKRSELIDKIDTVNANRKWATLKRNVDLFFDPELFLFNPDFRNRDELLEIVCHKMFTRGYVETDFINYVYERENASSTAFGVLALPHSIKMDAVKTCIAVIISPKGIRWGKDERVHVVFLIAINRVDRTCFAESYDALLDIFNRDDVSGMLDKITDFEKFRDILIKYRYQ
ncbi:PTS sugar transporter subunit IIA [Xenorhabdus sp. XENO-10]|uniref:PTS sugar transporter subunit IIA n=1 Tax=Xenorhabdus yunnanensis TaxID=3025878 RepID=A0ABT5L9V8_9GAMM|nr:PTS sugar transporter subunit IIA [Xenorhabdus yunnanensis]MDC9587771.1 PTS sugar transporter subunit IIA [Xenorhabdus yunnanensis]